MLAASFGKSEGNSAFVAERASFAGSAFSFSFSSLPLSPLLDRDLRDLFPLRPLRLPLLSSDLEDEEDEDDELVFDTTLLQMFFEVSEGFQLSRLTTYGIFQPATLLNS